MFRAEVNDALLTIYHRLISLAEKITQGKYWIVKSVLVIVFFNLIFFVPRWDEEINPEISGIHKYIDNQINHPLTPQPFDLDPLSHLNKRAFRITVPIIAHILHLNIYRVFALQQILGIATLVLLLYYFYKLKKDKVSSFFFTAAASFTYLGRSYFIDRQGYFDSYSTFILLASVFVRSKIALPFLYVALIFSDERNIISTFWLSTYKTVVSNGDKPTLPTLKSLIFSPYQLLFYFSVGTYFALRRLLHTNFGLDTTTMKDKKGVGIFTLLDNFDTLRISCLGAFDAFWIYVPLFMAIVINFKKPILSAAWLIIITLTLLSPAFVYDNTRSALYLLPMLLLSFITISNLQTEKQFKYSAIFCFVACFLIPSFFMMQGGIRIGIPSDGLIRAIGIAVQIVKDLK